MIRYRFEILKALKDAGYTTTRLRKEVLLGENAIQKLRHGQLVSLQSLDKICRLLNIQPGLLLEYVPDEKKED